MQQVPHRCPVCKGRRTVKAGFYVAQPQQTSCLSCSGSGIIYTWDYEPSWVYQPAPFFAAWRCVSCGGWVANGLAHWCTPFTVQTPLWTWTNTTSSTAANSYISTATVTYGPPSFPPDESAGLPAPLPS